MERNEPTLDSPDGISRNCTLEDMRWSQGDGYSWSGSRELLSAQQEI